MDVIAGPPQILPETPVIILLMVSSFLHTLHTEVVYQASRRISFGVPSDDSLGRSRPGHYRSPTVSDQIMDYAGLKSDHMSDLAKVFIFGLKTPLNITFTEYQSCWLKSLWIETGISKSCNLNFVKHFLTHSSLMLLKCWHFDRWKQWMTNDNWLEWGNKTE